MQQEMLMLLLILLAGFTASESNINFNSHQCNRECKAGEAPMVCEYDIHIETYASMSKACYMCPFNITDCDRQDCVTADGVPRLIYTVNRQLPSPQIRVCEDDIIKVNVLNHMNNGEGTSIHWHGIHQMNTAYMDGVSMLTQCPILPLSTYQYSFKASPHGTHYYHAHVGMQRGDGIAGALIVKPHADVHSTQYQYDLPEHTIIVQDWFHITANGKGMMHLHAKDNNRPDTIIINGRAAEMVSWPKWSTEIPQPDTKLGYPTFKVVKGSSYRFRVISNVVMNCPIEMYIEDHSVLVISSDGADIEPVSTDVLVISGGERYDFVLTANSSVGNFWMYFRGITDCSQRKTQSLAVLHYKGAQDVVPLTTPNTYDQRPPNHRTLNPFSNGMVVPDPTDNYYTLTELKSFEKERRWLHEAPTTKVYLQIGLHRTDNPMFNVPGIYGWADLSQTGGGTVLAQINWVNGILPAWPYLSQYHDIPQTQFCDVDSPSINETYCADNFCQCAHRLRVKLGEIVELVLIDRGKHWNISNHPMHIHGQFLHIISVGQNESMVTSRDQIEDLDSRGLIARHTRRPIKKDTVMVPDGGYIVGRFKADNPGPWFLHCHNELHVEQGMSLVIEVGEPETWPQNPTKAHKCGPYKEQPQPVKDQLCSNASQSQLTVLILYVMLILVL